MSLRAALTVLAFAFCSLETHGQDGKPLPVQVPDREEPVSFALEISEILFDQCVGCHSSALAENGLNLEDHASLMKGGKTGPAVVPGDSAKSLLFLLAAHEREPAMPPLDEPGTEPLPPESLGLIKLWIDQGAKDDTEAMAAALDAKESEKASISLAPLPPGVQPIVAVDVSDDGTLVAVGRANLVFIYDVETGEERARLPGHLDIVQSVRFSPDKTRLAAGGYRTVLVWRAVESTEPAEGGGVEPDAGETDGEDRPNAESVQSPSYWTQEMELGPHASRVLALDFSPDGARLATGAGEPSRSGSLKIWDLVTRNVTLDLPELHSDTIFGLRFSPNGTRLATAAADKFVKVLNVEDGSVLRTLEGHTHHVMAVDWQGEGRLLASGGADNVIKIWDNESGEQVRTTQPAGKQLTSLRWIAGRSELVGSSGDHTVRVWNAENGNITRTLNGPADYVFGVSISRDGRRIAAGDASGTLFLWDDQGQLIKSIPPPEPLPPHE